MGIRQFGYCRTLDQHARPTTGTRTIKEDHRTDQEVIDELYEMLKHGIVRRSKSPYSSPVVIITNDGGMRFCIDKWHLNDQTKIDQYKFPRIDDVLDSLSGAWYFSMLDLASGYW